MEASNPALGVDAKGEIVNDLHIDLEEPMMQWGVDNGVEDPDHLFVDFKEDGARVQLWFENRESVDNFIELLEEHKERLD